MINKRDYNLVFLKYLKTLLDYKADLLRSEITDDRYLKFLDISEGSDFFYQIDLDDLKEQRTEALVIYKPRHENEKSSFSTRINVSKIKESIDSWLSLIRTYEEFQISSDLILDEYTKEYYEEFTLIDDETNQTPLKIKQILLLDSYLEDVDSKIDDFNNGDNDTEIKDIQEDIRSLRKSLPKFTKSEVVRKLSKISAKMSKAGIGLIKEFLSETKKELIKHSLGYLIENGPALIETALKQLNPH